MKHVLFVLLFISVGFVGCSDNTATTDGGDAMSTENGSVSEEAGASSFRVKNPGAVSDAETTVAVHSWVPGLIKTNPDKVAVNMCIQNGNHIYFITMDKTADIKTKVAEIYNAKQEKICEIGGPQMVNTCPDFTFDGSKDCKAVFLK